MQKLISQNGLLIGKTIGYSGFFNLILLLIRIKQMNLFDASEFNEDMKHEYKRTKSLIKNNPYVNDYLRKMQDPEYGISYIKCLICFLTIYLFMSILYNSIESMIMLSNWFTSVYPWNPFSELTNMTKAYCFKKFMNFTGPIDICFFLLMSIFYVLKIFISLWSLFQICKKH